MNIEEIRDRAILVLEDEYMLADDLRKELVDLSAKVIGPAATVDQGWELLRAAERIDGAILDINLRGEEVFALADALVTQAVPFVFLTGYDASIIPDHLRHVERCEKPVKIAKVVEALGRAMTRPVVADATTSADRQ